MPPHSASHKCLTKGGDEFRGTLIRQPAVMDSGVHRDAPEHDHHISLRRTLECDVCQHATGSFTPCPLLTEHNVLRCRGGTSHRKPIAYMGNASRIGSKRPSDRPWDGME